MTTIDDAVKREIVLGKGGASPAGWSSIESFFRCPKEFQFRSVRGIHKPSRQDIDALAIGKLFHAGRSVWFANKFSVNDAALAAIAKEMVTQREENELPISQDAFDRAVTIMNAYIEHWEKRAKPVPVEVEVLIDTEVFGQRRTARLDDVSFYPEAGNQLCIGEAKTTSETVGAVENIYTLHGQTLGQHILWRKALNGMAQHGRVAGTMIDVVEKKYGNEKPKFGRVFLPVSEFSISWFEQSLAFYAEAASRVKWDTEVPRNIVSCTRQYGKMKAPCEFRELCLHGSSATGMYVLKNGDSLKDRSKWEGEKEPWL